MKKCAKCDFEYDDSYDGCPVCARTEERPPVPSTGSLIGGLLSILGYFFLVGLMAGLTGDVTAGAIISLLVFSAIVTVDAGSIRKGAKSKAPGILGTHPLVWGLGVLALAIVFIPMYFYQRPRLIVAYQSALAGAA